MDASFIDFKDESFKVKAGYGCIVRDSSGNLIDYWAGVISYDRATEEAELMAFYYAHNAIEFDYSNIELEGNYHWVINKINR